jgi:hypothetical protein
MFPELRDDEIERVAAAIRAFYLVELFQQGQGADGSGITAFG